jgi:hypothetical protein
VGVIRGASPRGLADGTPFLDALGWSAADGLVWRFLFTNVSLPCVARFHGHQKIQPESHASFPRLPPNKDNENGSPGKAVASIVAPPERPAMRQIGIVSADRIQSSPPRRQRRHAANNWPSLQITIQHR